MENIKSMIKEKIAEIAEISPDHISDEISFKDDLDLDSMLALEILADLEKMFGILIPEKHLEEFVNLNKVVGVVQKCFEKESV